MKTTISVLTALMICLTLLANAGNGSGVEPRALNGSLKILSSPELSNLAGQWADNFRKLHPEADIQVIVKDFKTPQPAVSGEVVELLSGNDLSGASMHDRRMVIARDIIVPVMNSNSPWAALLNEKGISRDALSSLLGSGHPEWGILLGNGSHAGLNLYMANDIGTEASLEHFTDNSSINSSAFKRMAPSELLAAISKDPDAIGFCRFQDILSADRQQFAENIRMVPVDRNGNGKMDYFEDIYETPDIFLRGVWIGKYPRPLSGEIFAVIPGHPEGPLPLAFMQWVVSDGQDLLAANGLCDLLASEKQSRIGMINAAAIEPVAATKSYPGLLWIAIILLTMIVVAWGFHRFFIRKPKGSYASGKAGAGARQLDETLVDLPGGLMYDKTHTWAFMEPNGLVKVGIDDFILHVTGSITRIEMKQPGEFLKKGDPLCRIIQTGKQLQLYAPVSGVIKSRNPLLSGDASLMNRFPYTQGWIYEVEPANWLREIGFLQMAQKYREWIRNEFNRLRDFFASAIQVHPEGTSALVLQDGGTLIDHPLAGMDPEIWEDFQSDFLDINR